MTQFYVAELHNGLFQNPQVLLPTSTSGWRLFARCREDDVLSCEIFHDLATFSSRHQRTFLQFLEYLFEAGKAGKPWKEIFQDGNLFHPVHDVEIERIDPKTGKRFKRKYEIHQFKKKRTGIRILFVYTDERLIAFITHAFEKDDAKTPNAEKSRAEQEVIDFFAAVDKKEVQLITDQGGKNATQGIFGN